MRRSSRLQLARRSGDRGQDRKRIERLCRYISRPPIARERLSELPDGRIAYPLRHRWRDGTTHVVFEPKEFLENLAVLVLWAPQKCAEIPRSLRTGVKVARGGDSGSFGSSDSGRFPVTRSGLLLSPAVLALDDRVSPVRWCVRGNRGDPPTLGDSGPLELVGPPPRAPPVAPDRPASQVVRNSSFRVFVASSRALFGYLRLVSGFNRQCRVWARLSAGSAAKQ